MKLERNDFMKLRRALVSAVLLISTSSALAWWSAQNHLEAMQKYQLSLRGKSAAEQRLQKMFAEEAEVKADALLLRQLEDRKILGEERRLEWTETLRKIKGDLHLPSMNYEFGAQTKLTGGQAFTFFSTPMQIRLHVLHEEDLLSFLEQIKAQASALVLLRHCKLYPLQQGNLETESPTLLGAECEMQWLTFQYSGQGG